MTKTLILIADTIEIVGKVKSNKKLTKTTKSENSTNKKANRLTSMR